MYKGEKVCYAHINPCTTNMYHQGLIEVSHKPANSSSSMDICSMLCYTELYFFRKAEQFLGISNSMRSDALDLHKVASLLTVLGKSLDNSHSKHVLDKLLLLQIGRIRGP